MWYLTTYLGLSYHRSVLEILIDKQQAGGEVKSLLECYYDDSAAFKVSRGKAPWVWGNM